MSLYTVDCLIVGASYFSGNAWYNESNIWYDGQMHISCPQRRCPQTARRDIFPGKNKSRSQGEGTIKGTCLDVYEVPQWLKSIIERNKTIESLLYYSNNVGSDFILHSQHLPYPR